MGSKGILGTLLMIGAAIYLGPAGIGLLTGGQALMFGVSALASGFLGDQAAGGARQQDPGFLVNKQSTQSPVYVAYGERRVGGHRVFIDTTNAEGEPGEDNNEFLHMVYAVSEGEIENIDQVLFNDKVIWDDAEDPKFLESKIDLAIWLGSDTQTFETPHYNSGDDLTWTHDDWYKNGSSDRHGKGVAWVYMRLQYDRELFPSVPRVIFKVRGRKVRDVETGTVAYSTNPANIIADYISSNTYGKGLGTSLLDTGANSSFVDYKNYCDLKGITFNGLVNTDNTIFDNMNKMLLSGNCFLTYANGVYKIRPNHAQDFTGAYTFNKDNIIGKINMELGSKKSKTNIAKSTFFDKDDFSQQNTVVQPLVTETNTYLQEDNNVVNEKSFQLDFCDNTDLATRLTRFQLDFSRYSTVVQFTTTWQASNIEVGDPVYLDYDRFYSTPKKFRVIAMSYEFDGTINITLAEYPEDEAIFLEDV